MSIVSAVIVLFFAVVGAAAVCRTLHEWSFGAVPLWTPATPGTVNARKACARGAAPSHQARTARLRRELAWHDGGRACVASFCRRASSRTDSAETDVVESCASGWVRCKTILPWQDSFMRDAKSMLHGKV